MNESKRVQSMDYKEVLKTRVYDDELAEIYRKFRFRVNYIVDMLSPLMPWNIVSGVYASWLAGRLLAAAIEIEKEEAYRLMMEKIAK